MRGATFLDRERELSLLENRYRSGRGEFVVIYGRRRVGKTELIEQFISRKGGVRLLAREESKSLQLRRFTERLAEFFKDDFLKKAPFTDWDGFFEYLSQKARRRVIIAIDEFPYLVKEDPSLPSILQDHWDGKLRKTKIFLVLCGSSISMMESKVLGHRSPLYGRRTAQLLLKPFDFRVVLSRVGEARRAVEFYSVFGGTPAYFLEADPNKDIFSNIREKILREDSFIYRDVEFILRQELVEPRYYFSILHSIARGNHTIGLIMNDTGLSKSIVNKYLSVLRDLQLVEHRVPVTEGHKSKRGLWFLSDNLFDFWFRFVQPNMDEVERGRADLVIEEHVKPHFEEYVGRHFERVAREALEEMNARSLLPARFTTFGGWWRGESEIDIVALNERTNEVLFGECKWSQKVDAGRVLAGLRERAQQVDWHRRSRREFYAIFAKSFRKKIAPPNTLLVDLRDVELIFRG